MYQVKIFRFTINNRTCSDVDDDKHMSWYAKEAKEVSSEEEIETILNEFLATHNVTNIQVTTFTCRKNDDRLRDDDVDILYTITYSIDDNEYRRKSVIPTQNQEILQNAQYPVNTPMVGQCDYPKQSNNLDRKRTRENSNYYNNMGVN